MGWVVKATLRSLYRYPLYRRLAGLQGLCERVLKISAPPPQGTFFMLTVAYRFSKRTTVCRNVRDETVYTRKRTVFHRFVDSPRWDIFSSELTIYSPVVTICTTRFNIHKFYVLPTQCIYVFCVDLRTNSDYFPIQHLLTGSYNRDRVCLLRGTDWALKYYVSPLGG